jgi:hypothetical protein
MEKAYLGIIAILGIFVIAIYISGFNFGNLNINQTTNQTNQTTNQIKNLTKVYNTLNFEGGEISFSYPPNWNIWEDRNSNNIITADPSNSTTFLTINIRPIPSNSTLNEYYNELYSQVSNDTQVFMTPLRVFEVNNLTAYENAPLINQTGKSERIIGIGHNNTMYFITASALIQNFENAQKDFNEIINTFKVK